MFIMLITYSFSTDYVSVPCKSEEEALKVMADYMTREAEVVREEQGYDPKIIPMAEDEKIMVYTSSDDDCIDAENYLTEDFATYKVIEANHHW